MTVIFVGYGEDGVQGGYSFEVLYNTLGLLRFKVNLTRQPLLPSTRYSAFLNRVGVIPSYLLKSLQK